MTSQRALDPITRQRQRNSHLLELEDAATRRDQLEAEMLALISAARRDGASWAAIGEAVGTSRQAAHERYAHLVLA